MVVCGDPLGGDSLFWPGEGHSPQGCGGEEVAVLSLADVESKGCSCSQSSSHFRDPMLFS